MLEPLLAKGFIPAEISDEDDALPLNLCLELGYVGRKDAIEVSSYVPYIHSRGNACT